MSTETITFVVSRVGKDWVTHAYVNEKPIEVDQPIIIASGAPTLTASRGPTWEIALGNARAALRRSGKVK